MNNKAYDPPKDTKFPGVVLSIKESSDELNPSVITADAVVRNRPARSGKDFLALAIATCGVGYLPLAPGTWGSLVGIGVYALVRGAALALFFAISKPPIHDLGHIYYGVIAVELIAVSLLILLGTWAASRTEGMSEAKDPSKVVIDEVAGQFIALLPVPFLVGTAWWSIIVAFVLFRFFDIVKPYPARRLESLEAGLGIMADDVVAGVYAAVSVAVVITLSWWV